MHQEDWKWYATQAISEAIELLHFDSADPRELHEQDIYYCFAVEGLEFDLQCLGFSKEEAIRLAEGN